jgi:hypothetical protein
MSAKSTDPSPDHGPSGFDDNAQSRLVSRLAVALVCAAVMVAALLVILSNVFHVV